MAIHTANPMPGAVPGSAVRSDETGEGRAHLAIMLNELLAERMRELHGLCDRHRDLASASLLENWIDEAERRIWFLHEAGRRD